MRKATATYNAPEGDNKVVEMGGVTFFDGQAVDLNSDDHGHLINKLPGNPHFDIEVGEEEKRNKGGRPSNAEKAAREQEEADKAAAEKAAADKAAADKLAS